MTDAPLPDALPHSPQAATRPCAPVALEPVGDAHGIDCPVRWANVAGLAAEREPVVTTP